MSIRTLRGSLTGLALGVLPMITSSSSLKANYSRKSLAPIVVHVANRVLRVPLRLIEVHVSSER